MTTERQEGPDLRRYVRLLWRRKWLVLAIVILIPAAVYAITSRQPKTYEASTVVQIRQTAGSALPSNQPIFAASGVVEAARVIRTTAVARVAAQELGEPPAGAGALLGAVRVATDDDVETGFLTITARSRSPERAAAIPNAFAAAIAATRTDQATDGINERIRTLQAQGGVGDQAARDQLNLQIQELRALRSSQAGATRVIEPATVPRTAISPQPRRSTTIAFVLALLLAAGVVPLLELFDRRLRDVDQLEELVGAPLLGTIPTAAFPGKAPTPHVREAFQSLRAGLTYFNVDRTLGSVIITSAARGDGKTTVATNLAVALAQDERDVILVDGDLRRPQVATRLGVRDQVSYGLESVLVEHRGVRGALIELEMPRGRLRVLPGAPPPPPNPSILLGSVRMRILLAKLIEGADIVIVDTPPLLAVSDAVPLLEQVTGAVLVARMNESTRDGLAKAKGIISSAGGNLLGVVATGARTEEYGYEGDYYGYGPTEEGTGFTFEPKTNGATGRKGRRAERKASEAAANSAPRESRSLERKPSSDGP